MRIISTKVHGYIDYLMGVLLIASPWLFGFYEAGGAASWVLIVMGSGTILYSLLTDYELGVGKVISMNTHLAFDFLAGILLAGSPWLFGFYETAFLPHLIFGLAEVGASIMTKSIPEFGNEYKSYQ